MVRRRRDQPHPRRRVAHLGDYRIDFVTGQLAAFTGLGALSHLDLNYIRVDQIFRRDPKAP